jgi:FMN reductase
MPEPPLIVGLGGTLRERSYSRAGLHEALRLAEARGARTELLDLRELDLPMFIPDIGVEAYPSQSRSNIARLLELCRRADAMLWASATYHGTVTGVLKNALDFLELLDDDSPPYLHGCAVGLMAVSDSETFAAMAGAAHELRAWLAPTYATLARSDFAPNMRLHSESAQRRLACLVDELMEFTQRARQA